MNSKIFFLSSLKRPTAFTKKNLEHVYLIAQSSRTRQLSTNTSLSKNLRLLTCSNKTKIRELIRLKSTEVPKKNKIISITWKSVLVTGIFGTALWLFMVKLRTEKDESIKRQRKAAIGKMAIGGPFELVDHHGKITKSSDFLGKWLLIYFGFTHCPDICPEEIDKMIRAVNLIEKVNIKDTSINPLFISVDPSRDDVNTVAKYVKDFSPKLLGLTGNKEQIAQVAKSYRVYLSEGPKDDDNDYIVDHTVIMYLIDPEGNFVDYFGQNKSAEEIATAAAIHMSTFKKGSKDDV